MKNPFEHLLGNQEPNNQKQHENAPGSPEMASFLMKIEGLFLNSDISADQKEEALNLIEGLDRSELQEDARFLLKTQPNQMNVTGAATTLVCRKLRNMESLLSSRDDTSRLAQLIEEIDVEASNWSDLSA